MNDTFSALSYREPRVLQLRNKSGSKNCLMFVPHSAIGYFKGLFIWMEKGIAKNYQLEGKERPFWIEIMCK